METFSRETLNPWFVSGFVDGEGSFTFSRSSRQLAVYFAIKGADRSFLETVQAFFGGIGKIYKVGAGYMFRVTRATELLVVVSHFDSYPLQTQKHAAYEVWRSMVQLKRSFRGSTREALEALAIQLSKTVARRS